MPERNSVGETGYRPLDVLGIGIGTVLVHSW